MGISSGSQKNKPIYNKEIEGAAGALSSTYNTQAPKIAGYADAVGSVVPDILSRFRAGDPAITAAKGYVTSTLGADSANNPFLDDMVGITNDNVRNQLQAKMGTRGTTGGSAYYDMIGRALAENETGLRYTDYDMTEQRKAQAAGMAPGLVAGEYLPLDAAMGAGAFASQLPLDAAAQYAAGTGGLLGQYQKVKTKSPWGPALVQGISNAAAAYAGGG
jgi:hypothetical protein